jgi:hypothetical protein
MTNSPNLNDPTRSNPFNDDLRNPTRVDNELQADPELAEGPASGSRMAVYAVGIVVVLGAVFYGLNNSSTPPTETKTASQSAPATPDSAAKPRSPTNNIADSQSKPPVAPGVRDVTPTNSQPGVTTGAAPARPQAPQNAPTGTEVDTSKSGTTK